MNEQIENLRLIQKALMHLMCEDDIYYNDDLYNVANESYTGLVLLKKAMEKQLEVDNMLVDSQLEDFLNED